MAANKTKEASIFFILLFMWSISSCSSAFNITNLLNKQYDFSTFNKYLSETKLADQINKRSTITVLAAANDEMGGLSSDDDVVLKSVMSVHVILDYFGREKLAKLAKNNRSATLTTLFQSSGVAQNQQGFVRVKEVDGEIYFGLASKGAQMNSKLVRSVTAQPFNISVLEVSSIIGVPNVNASSAPEKAPAPKKGKSPSLDDESLSGDTAESPVDVDTLDTDEDEEGTEAPSPSDTEDSTPPKPGYDDDLISADSPSFTPTPAPSKSDALATTAAEMGFGVVCTALLPVWIIVLF